MNRVRRHFPFSLVVLIATRVEITVEARKVTARDFQTDPVSGSEVITGGLKIDLDLVNFSLLHPNFLVKTFAITRAQNTLLHVESATIRLNIHEFCREVSVQGGGRDIQHD